MVLVPTGASASPNLPDLPAPPLAVMQAPKKAVKHTRGTAKQKAAARKTTAAAPGKVVVAHSAR